MENYLEKWNPLEIISMNAEENYRKLAISSTKQQIRNILKSYVGYYDPFCELLQNAMDATDRMAHIVKNEYRKKLKIYIDCNSSAIRIEPIKNNRKKCRNFSASLQRLFHNKFHFCIQLGITAWPWNPMCITFL